MEPVDRRPGTFIRGYDVYDAVKVGFVADGEDAQRVGTPHDVSLKGNGNQGHAYGTQLPAADKEALLEYLKTL